MTEEKQLILNMLKEGKITVEEASDLLGAIGDKKTRETDFAGKVTSAVDSILKKATEAIGAIDLDQAFDINNFNLKGEVNTHKDIRVDDEIDEINIDLVNGEIYLEKDETDRDKYDRLLRYIWLEKPVTDPSLADIETKTLNGLLVKEGYAYSNYYKPNIKYQDYLEEIEKSAQENGLGVWSKGKNGGSQKGKIDKSYFIKGNKNSKVYHLPDWDSYNTVKEKNAVYFENEKEAKEAGFRPVR